MALIKCPECAHDVSDTAVTCPNCGYALKKEIVTQKRASFFETNKKTIIGIIVAIIIIGIIYAIVQSMPVKTPFDKVQRNMTLEEGRSLIGTPDQSDNPNSDLNYYRDRYNNISFMGMNADLTVWYYSSKDFHRATWMHRLEDGETFSTYEKPINKIVDYYTEKYGAPTSEYYTYEWHDMDGASITLDLNKQYNWINLEYD